MTAVPHHDGQAALAASRQAMLEGRIQDANNHLQRAARFGADPAQINALGQEISFAVKHHNLSAASSTWWSLGVGLVAYLVLSLQQPLDWGVGAWVGLAFIGVPAIMGAVIGRGHGSVLHFGVWFWKAWWCSGLLMSGYTALNLCLLRARFGELGDAVMLFVVGLVVTMVFASLAGLAAGLVSVCVARFSNREAIRGAAH